MTLKNFQMTSLTVNGLAGQVGNRVARGPPFSVVVPQRFDARKSRQPGGRGDRSRIERVDRIGSRPGVRGLRGQPWRWQRLWWNQPLISPFGLD